MYNRYIPQNDGSYRRKSMPDKCNPIQKPQQPVPTVPPCPPPANEPCTQEPPRKQKCQDAGSFLKNLLPKDLDTGDLLVIVLLLLMSGDSSDDKSTALLTLALYLLM